MKYVLDARLTRVARSECVYMPREELIRLLLMLHFLGAE